MPLIWQNSLLCLRQAQAMDHLYPILVQVIHVSYIYFGKRELIPFMKQHNYKIKL